MAKLYPITLALMIFAYFVLPNSERIPGPRGKVLELTLLQAWWPSQRVYFGGNGVSWSLSCEIFFYLAFPFVLAAVKRLRDRGFWTVVIATTVVLVAAPVIAVESGVSEPVRYWLFFVFPLYQFGFFLIGMLMARAIGGGMRFPRPTMVFSMGLVWLGVIVAFGSIYSLDHAHGLSRPLVLLLALPAFIGILGSAASKDLSRRGSFITKRPLTYLGIISFELYLVHKPLFLWLKPLGVWRNAGGLEGLAVFTFFLGAAVLIAIAFHHFFQVPVERYLTRPHHPWQQLMSLARKARACLVGELMCVVVRYAHWLGDEQWVSQR